MAWIQEAWIEVLRLKGGIIIFKNDDNVYLLDAMNQNYEST